MNPRQKATLALIAAAAFAAAFFGLRALHDAQQRGNARTALCTTLCAEHEGFDRWRKRDGSSHIAHHPSGTHQCLCNNRVSVTVR